MHNLNTLARVLPLLFIATATAQTAVLPNGFAATEGNGSTPHPFGVGNNASRVQYVYDTAGMIAAGMNGPLSIHTIEWRANGTAGNLGGTHAGAGITLKIGTCAFDHLGISTTFNSNFASSASFLLNPVVVADGAGMAPNIYTTQLTIPGGFAFDPGAGQDLVIEIAIPGGVTWTSLKGNISASAMDLHSSVGVGGSRLFATNNAAATGTRVVNSAAVVRLGFTPTPGTASNQDYGVGCGSSFASLYEHFPNSAAAAIALSGTSIRFTNLGTHYAVSNGTAVFVPYTGNGATFQFLDDQERVMNLTSAMPYPGGTTTSLIVCSNGFVSVATGNGQPFAASPATMLGVPRTGWWSNHDYDPSIVGSGQVSYVQLGNVVHVTWDGVWDYGGTSAANASTFQYQIDTTTGDVSIVWVTMSGLGNGHLVGYSPGGSSENPGSISLATGLPIVTATGDVLPLTIGAAPRPLLGTPVTYTVTNIDPAALFSAHIMSLGGIDPGFDLGLLGAPRCRQYVDLSLASTFLLFGGPTATNLFSVPNDASLAGLPLDNQAASLLPGSNPLGAVTSGAVVSTIGIL